MLSTSILVCFLLGVFGEPVVEYRQFIIDKHNEYRRAQLTSNMNALTWNDSLARSADAWIANCHFAHPKNLHDEGENLAASRGHPTELIKIARGMKGWYDEIQDYTYGKGCTKGRVCGHYTQLVWAMTTQVGCAVTTCPSLTFDYRKPMKNAFFISCRYHQRGNFKKKLPFKKGDACSECAEGQGCTNGLCTGSFCIDQYSGCAKYANYCFYKNNEPYMRVNCAKTCNFC